VTTDHRANQALVDRLRLALYNLNRANLEQTVREVVAPGALIQLASPFETLDGPGALLEQAYLPLIDAIPDLERRDIIVMAGEANGDNWVGCAGYYTGVFERPWLTIPPTQHIVWLRFHEYYRVADGQIVELQALWDIPAVMMQAGAWPLAPSLGVEWLVPGPAAQDGIQRGPYDAKTSAASVQLVLDMIDGLMRFAEGGAEAMQLERFWHPHMTWYGPAGIGTARRISGFRNWHQIPFLKAMPNRKALMDRGVMFGDNSYVAFTAWPGMTVTISGDGWLGIVPSDQAITMRSLDFWRCENGLLRENWVLVDLLHVYDQIGVDVFSRMRELTVARQPQRPVL
jgi:hypothetical protein